MRRRESLLLLLMIAAARPVRAQQHAAPPVRFGVTWTQARAQGALADVADDPRGFTAWVSLPLARRLPLGLRAEFSILPFPEQQLILTDPSSGGTLTTAVRGSIGFTGAGPRVEFRRGAVGLVGAVMGGFVRTITDVNARSRVDDRSVAATFSENDYALAGKVSADLHLGIYRGSQGDGVGIVVGADWMTAREVTFPVRQTLRLRGGGGLAVDQRPVRPMLLGLRAGMSVQF